MNDKVKILINSSPRSGHAFLQYCLLETLDNKKISIGDISDEFIIRANAPIILFGSFKDIIQTTILRKPEDIIPSIVTKTMGGLGNTITSNINMPHELNHVPELSILIRDQFDIYHRWTNSIIKNISTLKPFTLEQVSNDTPWVVNSLLKNFDVKYRDISNEDFISNALTKITIHDKGHPGFNNAVPIERKPDVYYEAVDIVKNNPLLQDAINKHKECEKLILDFQKSSLW